MVLHLCLENIGALANIFSPVIAQYVYDHIANHMVLERYDFKLPG